jgi:hypothetical protein
VKGPNEYLPRAKDMESGAVGRKVLEMVDIIPIENIRSRRESNVKHNPAMGAFSRYNLLGRAVELEPRPRYIFTGLQTSVFLAATRPQASQK